MNIYAGGRLRVAHADLYRLEREAELVELGLEDAMGDPRTVCLIEWADKFPQLLPAGAWRIELAHADEARELTSALEPQLLGSMR